MSSSVPLPSPDDDYSAPVDSDLTLAFWDAALTSVGRRIRALEAVKAGWEELISVGTGQALEVIAANVEPQLASLTTTINQLKADVALAQDAIAAITVGSVPATVVYETAARLWLTPALRDVWNAKQAGDPTLSALAALETSADKLIYATGADSFSLATITTFARELLASGTSAVFRSAIAAAGTDETAKALSAKASLRNRLLNSAFQVCQDRATGATITLSARGYAFDGIYASIGGDGSLTCSQFLKSTPGGSLTRFRATVGTSDGSIASADYYALGLFVEGSDVADFLFGTGSAKPFTFRAIVSLPAGTYHLSFMNEDGTRSYVVPFTITALEADKDKLLTAVVPGDTIGTWKRDASGTGLRVRLCLACGSNYQTASPNSWQNGTYFATSSQTNAMFYAANVFEIADVGLYLGTDLPTFEMPRLIDDLIACRRLFRTGFVSGGGYATAAVGGFHLHNERFGAPMRVVPGVSFTAGTYSMCSSIVAGLITQDGFNCTVTASAANTNYAVSYATFFANARL